MPKIKKHTTPQDIVKAWKLNKVILSSKMGVSAYTFKMKLLNHHPYKFTQQDNEKLAQVLRELATEIENTLTHKP